MTLDEQKSLKKSTWIILLILPVFFLFLWVAYSFPSLPFVMRAAAVGIPAMAVLIFTQHHFKKLKDLSTSEVEEYHGIVNKKVDFKRYNRIGSRRNKSETRYILLAGKKFRLSRKQMAKCTESKEAIVVVAPMSQVVLSVSTA
ncbi:hypothetical protein [Nonlabens dokdonensis]|uniref:Uncharacterized protein n=2 Tax=Nonlabens dokdonensis TaxID=328515 RepID=L7W6K5_NONDD|nr:hypothetical protein [Nonlabens dokdonensis]AGC75764.1 hypothetical protein DDD_0637 [Nonlabens dokdonensis DSW-6]